MQNCQKTRLAFQTAVLRGHCGATPQEAYQRQCWCMQDLHAPEALGSALVQVLLERHGSLPAEVECGLLLAAHSCYEAGSCADALEVLVQLAQRAMQQWAQSGDWRPLVQLISGESQPCSLQTQGCACSMQSRTSLCPSLVRLDLDRSQSLPGAQEVLDSREDT